MTRRKEAGIWDQTHQRNPMAMRSKTVDRSRAGRVNIARRNRITPRIEKPARAVPGTIRRRNSRTGTQSGTLG
jgi:hypothetical protein